MTESFLFLKQFPLYTLPESDKNEYTFYINLCEDRSGETSHSTRPVASVDEPPLTGTSVGREREGN